MGGFPTCCYTSPASENSHQIPPQMEHFQESEETMGHQQSRNASPKNSNALASNIILNHDFSEGIHFWQTNSCEWFVVREKSDYIEGVTANSGSNFAVVKNRTEWWQSLEQDITDRVSPCNTYQVSACVRVSKVLNEPVEVIATLRQEFDDGSINYLHIGRVNASAERWENLEGTFSLETIPKRVVFYLEGPSPGIDLLIDSVVVSPPIIVEHESSLTDNIIHNHDFAKGLHSWHPNSCNGFVVTGESGKHEGVSAYSGTNYVVLKNRKECWQGLEQDITGRVSPGTKYIVIAYVRVSGFLQESAQVQATLKLEYPDSSTKFLSIGRVSTSEERWEKLLGTFCLETMPKHVVFYLEGPAPNVDLLIDSVVVSSTSIKESKKTANINKLSADGDETIILNPWFEDGINNWAERGCKILVDHSIGDDEIVPVSGNCFARATERTSTWNGIQQDITRRVHNKLSYDVRAIVRICGNNVTTADVRATLWVQMQNQREQYIGIANSQASDKDWVELRGKFLVNASPSKAVIYLEGPPMGVDILVDSFLVKRAKKLLASPPPSENVLFGSNIIENSSLRNGLNAWSPLGSCTLNVCTGSPLILPPMARDSLGPHERLSGRYILVTNRLETWMGPSQIITHKVKLHSTYQVSAWVRIGSGVTSPQNINVAVGVDSKWVNGGQIEVRDDKWHEVGGSFRIEKQPSEVMVYIQGPSPGVDLMVAGLHIFPVDRKARFKHLKMQTDKIRKRDVILKVSGSNTGSLSGAVVKVKQTKNSFPFGSCISRSNIDNEDFVDFFVKNFNWGVFGNELKWYWTEPEQGKLNCKDADELLEFCKNHNINVRGHCIFWEVHSNIQSWVQSLDKNDLMKAVQNRLTSLLTRYKGKFKHYDVNNEMLHGSWYQDMLGKDIRSYMFKAAKQIDPSATLFVNDYHVEDGCDGKSSPEMYVQHILDLQEQGAPVGGIGIQGHIDFPIGPIICSALDKLAILGLPIWFTELDVASSNEHVRAEDLEVMLREAFAHPAVEGIVLWGFWELFMCRDDSHLVDAEGSINEAGKKYLELKEEWLSNAHGHIDDEGEFRFRGFHGDYSVEIITESKKISKKFVVDKDSSEQVVTINL